MGRYAHLTLAEREEIMLMRHEGRSQADIARATGRDRSAISREMRRNSFRVGAGRCCRASAARRSCEARRLSCVRPEILDDAGLAGLVTRLIVRERWSPEQIAGRIGVERPDLSVSVSTIYRAVTTAGSTRPSWSAPNGASGRACATGASGGTGGAGPRRDAAGSPGPGPYRNVRPRSSCARLGDWEGDTVVGRGSGACPVTLVDRMSGLLVGGRAATHTKRDVADVETAALAGRPESRMVTLDRGKEFADFARVEEATGAVFCFALPHHPWQRGTNENTNGLVREYFPKGTDFDAVSDEWVVRCMMRSTTGRASAMASGRPTRSTIRRRCTCSENSSH